MLRLSEMADPVRWFDALGKCPCGQSATGILRGLSDESYGTYCYRCATKRLAAAARERQKEAEREHAAENKIDAALSPASTPDTRVAWSVKDWAKAVSVTPVTVHRLIAANKIRSRLMGSRKRLILTPPQEYVQGLEKTHGATD